MANKAEPNSPEEFPPDIRAAFESYPAPKPGAEFDAKFWRELDARKNRYRGFAGFWRRLVEVEIEGVAVWRLGFSGLSGAAFCAVGLGLLSLNSPRVATPAPVATTIDSTGVPHNSLRYARQLWDELSPRPITPRLHRRQPTRSQYKDSYSCVSSAHGWA